MSRAHVLLFSFTQEELRHFETKVEKHSHYQEQLELSHQKLRHVEALGDKEHIKRNQEKYNTLSEKTREMGYKVRRDAGRAARTWPTAKTVTGQASIKMRLESERPEVNNSSCRFWPGFGSEVQLDSYKWCLTAVLQFKPEVGGSEKL